jgi:hypothetical protein
MINTPFGSRGLFMRARVIFALLAVALVSGCRAGESFDGLIAYAHVESQTALGPRPPGSPAVIATADLITDHLTAHGWEVEVQEFEYRGVLVRNIIGRSPAHDASKPVIILGAHYDTRRSADQEDPSVMVLGANDGGSGVAVLLELARVLDPSSLRHRVWLAFFDAEDNGGLDGWEWCVGSLYMAANLEIEPEAVIVVDMVGDADQQLYYERNSDAQLQQELWQIADELGYSQSFVPEYRWAMYDDHIPFAQRGITAIDIIDFDYPYWHTTQDTLDKVSAESLERVGRVLEEYLENQAR